MGYAPKRLFVPVAVRVQYEGTLPVGYVAQIDGAASHHVAHDLSLELPALVTGDNDRQRVKLQPLTVLIYNSCSM